MIKLLNILKESDLKKGYRVIFMDMGEEEYPTQKVFATEKEAKQFAEYESFVKPSVEVWNANIDDYEEVSRIMYHNPEDGYDYFSYKIEPVETKTAYQQKANKAIWN
jgi:hypothetical protein